MSKTIDKPVIVKASANGVLQTPRKVGEVAALVRGRSIDDALVILDHTPRRAATVVKKVILSAKANATNNHGLKADSLYIDQIFVTAATRMKRYRTVGRGRINPWQKKTSHVFVHLGGTPKPAKKAKVEAKPAAKKAATKKSTTKKESK